MQKLKYMIKRNFIELILIIIAVNMLIFCCDYPVIKGFEIYNHTGKEFYYDFCMVLLTTIFIYLSQKVYMHFSQIKKYDKLIYMQCENITECIKAMVWMITGEYDYLNVSKNLLLSNLKDIDIYNTGSGHYLNNKELLIKDALLSEDRKMLYRIDTLLEMSIVDSDLRVVLFELRTLDMHKEWEDRLLNANGHLDTIEQEKGNSLGGMHADFYRERCIAEGLEQCIGKSKEIKRILEIVYGYKFSL